MDEKTIYRILDGWKQKNDADILERRSLDDELKSFAINLQRAMVESLKEEFAVELQALKGDKNDKTN